MPHLTIDTAESREVHGVTFTSFANSRTGARQLGAWQASFPPRTAGLAHTMSTEEVLRVLVGALAFEVDDERFIARPGEAVIVPAGARFRVSNDTDEHALAWIVTPIGMTALMLDSNERFSPPWAQ